MSYLNGRVRHETLEGLIIAPTTNDERYTTNDREQRDEDRERFRKDEEADTNDQAQDGRGETKSPHRAKRLSICDDANDLHDGIRDDERTDEPRDNISCCKWMDEQHQANDDIENAIGDIPA